MKEKKFYIYAHTIAFHNEERPFEQIFYIGRGCGKRAHSKFGRTNYWKNIVNKYGYNINFLETELTNEEANIAEIKYIKEIGREDLGQGTLINLSDGGGGSNNPSKETRKKIGAAHKGKIPWNKDKKMSKESIEKNRRAHTGLTPSEETKKKMSESQKGEKNHFFGKNHTSVTKIKMSGRVTSEAIKIKISKANKGKKLSNEHKNKISKSLEGNKRNLGKYHTEETKRKISEAIKLRKY